MISAADQPAGEPASNRCGAFLALGLVVLVVALGPVSYYELYAGKNAWPVSGVVTGVQKLDHASQPKTRRYAGVKLEDGSTVTARVDGHLVIVPGSRVDMVETTTPLLGLKFYRVRSAAKPSSTPR